MTSTLVRPPVVERWPDLAVVPRSLGRAAVARSVLRRATRRLPFDVRLSPGPSGERPVLELRRPDAFFRRLGAGGLIGFGEAYQAGDWDSDDLVGLVAVLAGGVESIVPRGFHWLRHVHGPRFPRDEHNTVDGARANIHRHYDLSNELFALFLDPSMVYSSALFADLSAPDDLTAAQHRKIDRLLDAVGLRAGQHLLEIGTGWGELAIRAARRGARVTTVTISAEQAALARQRADAAGVGDRIDIQLRDYRQVEAPAGGFDAVVSVEMIEAVGERYWPAYFRALDALLAPGGRVGLQAITMRHARMLAARRSYTWMHKYIFPGGLIPSVTAIEEVLAAHTSLRITDRFDFGPHYAETLRQWRERFAAADIERLGFDETFRRTWRLYLAYSEAGFRSGYLDVCQLVLERP